MNTLFRGIVLLFAVLLCSQSIGQTTKADAAKKNEDTAAKSKVKRPPLEPGSFDVGLYEMRASAADKTLPFFKGETRTVNAELGTTFGFIFQLTGYTGTRLVPIISVTKHPAFTPKGETAPRTVREEKTFFKPINGVMKWPFLYRFDSAEELVPGDWTLSVYYDTQLIAEHTFTVVAPEAKK
jgi:hypothetical protein